MLNLLKNILYPKFCLSCGKFGNFICKSCRDKLIYCHETPGFDFQSDVDTVVSIFQYNAVLKKIIINIKYRLVTDALRELIEEIDKDIIHGRFPLNESLCIQPIPLHPSRRKQRGFNQAEIIANWLALQLNAEVLNSLERTKATLAQAQLSREERMVNMKGVFKLKNGQKTPLATVIVVDDVITTGSTINAAASVLKAAGVSRVIAFSIAQG